MRVKVGDKVKWTKYSGLMWYKDNVYEVLGVDGGNITVTTETGETASSWSDGAWEKVENTVTYEDKWVLNEGQEIPKDAELLRHPVSDSIVAYREVKKPKVTTTVRYVYEKFDRSGYFLASYPDLGDRVGSFEVIITDGKLTEVKVL